MDKVNKYRELLVLVALVLIWFVRLESKVMYMEKNQDDTKQEISSLQNSINTLILAVGRVEGKLSK